MNPLDLVKLTPLMQRTGGRAEIKVGLIDGPVAMDHPDFAGQNILQVGRKLSASCSRSSSFACSHGTFVAGVLGGKRNSAAPAICPDCTLLVRPIFPEAESLDGDIPTAKPEELALAIVEVVNAGAKVVNLSAALAHLSAQGEGVLAQALDHALRNAVIIVAAAGNQGTVGGSSITRHPWVVPVTGCDLDGRPTSDANLGNSIGHNGLMAPAREITSLGADGKPRTSGGTSAAAPFVTGTIALLWSEFPSASATVIRMALRAGSQSIRTTVVPPLLDAWKAYEAISASNGRKAS